MNNKKKKKVNLKLIVIDVLIVAVIAVIGFQGYRIYNRYQELNQTKITTENIKREIGAFENEEWKPTQETYRNLKAENEDYIGWLLWDSGIISEPIVQGTSNDSYMRTDFYGNYDEFGTVFLDSLASLRDDNLPIYGHAMTGVYTDTRKFSQLQNMTKQEFYESNKTFSIYRADQVTHYEVMSAFLIDVDSDDWNYTQNVFNDDSDKQSWIDQALSRSEINTGITADITDKFVTFQTCRDGYSGWRYIVIGRQTGVEPLY